MEQLPLTEFDPSPLAVLQPHDPLKGVDVPHRCVITYFREVLEKKAAQGELRLLGYLHSECVDLPVYETEAGGERVCLTQGFVGSAGAAGTLDELIAAGCDTFVVCGGAGVLRRDITVGHLVLPVSAVRDEGASFHYAPPSREIACEEAAVQYLAQRLDALKVPYLTGKTWTTDAIYRETKQKVAARVAEGCLTVEMEASAYFAVAQFRGVRLGQILYGGDDVSGQDWDSRAWDSRGGIRENLVNLSLLLCADMPAPQKGNAAL
ncbi:MAG: nucleoside phosphorylase [Eubacteriales bacterium]|nr:nucleoside phosphorylase [Eubacteriales bacterium]